MHIYIYLHTYAYAEREREIMLFIGNPKYAYICIRTQMHMHDTLHMLKH